MTILSSLSSLPPAVPGDFPPLGTVPGDVGSAPVSQHGPTSPPSRSAAPIRHGDAAVGRFGGGENPPKSQPAVDNRVIPQQPENTGENIFFSSPIVTGLTTRNSATTGAGRGNRAGSGRGIRERRQSYVDAKRTPFRAYRKTDGLTLRLFLIEEPGRQFQISSCIETANIRTQKGGKMPNKTPLTAQVSMKLMTARMIVHRVFYRDETIDEQEQRALDEIDAATLDAEAADLARVEAVHVINHGQTTAWHTRKRRELAKLREMKTASTVAAIEAE